MVKKPYDPTKERQQIVPESEKEIPSPEMAADETPAEPSPEAAAPAPEAKPESAMPEPMIKLSISDIPEMSGKKPGDMVSLNIDVEVSAITDDSVDLKLVSAKEVPGEENKEEAPSLPDEKKPMDKEAAIKEIKPKQA